MHDDRTGEVVKRRTECVREPRLDAEPVVPSDSFEQRINEPDDHAGREELRVELRTLGDASRHDRRHGCRERQEEEEAHERVAVVLREDVGPMHELHAVCNVVADEEVREGGYREVHEDLDQRVHLILAPDRPQFEKREARVHGQHHGGAQQ